MLQDGASLNKAVTPDDNSRKPQQFTRAANRNIWSRSDLMIGIGNQAWYRAFHGHREAALNLRNNRILKLVPICESGDWNMKRAFAALSFTLILGSASALAQDATTTPAQTQATSPTPPSDTSSPLTPTNPSTTSPLTPNPINPVTGQTQQPTAASVQSVPRCPRHSCRRRWKPFASTRQHRATSPSKLILRVRRRLCSTRMSRS